MKTKKDVLEFLAKVLNLADKSEEFRKSELPEEWHHDEKQTLTLKSGGRTFEVKVSIPKGGVDGRD